MNRTFIKYLSNHFSTKPRVLDRLIISAFLSKNKVEVKKNNLLKQYIISDKNTKEFKNLKSLLRDIETEEIDFTIETLIELFEFIISPKDKKITGAVYTPSFIREYIVSSCLPREIKFGWKAADLACGCGGFLLTLANHIKKKTSYSYAQIFKNNLYGLDIKTYSIDRTKLLLTIQALVAGEDSKEFEFNLFAGDALEFSWKNQMSTLKPFDCIVGNPPYVCSRRLNIKTRKNLLKYEVCLSGHPDLYIPFFQIGLELLKPKGILGLITMNTFFKSLNARALRKYFDRKRPAFKILDLGTMQVFKKKSAYTCICFLENIPAEFIKYKRLTSLLELSKPLDVDVINYSELKAESGWNLQTSHLINKIESMGTAFSKIYKTRNGIATLKNDVFIFEPVNEKNGYYWLQNGKLYQIEKGICKDIVNSNALAKESTFDLSNEKCIFPYEIVDKKAKIFSELKLKDEYPFAYKYLVDKKELLASRDKGKGKYPKWFAFGRTQCLEQMEFKLFFPHLTAKSPNFVLNDNKDTLFYNGLAVIGNNEIELLVLKNSWLHDYSGFT